MLKAKVLDFICPKVLEIKCHFLLESTCRLQFDFLTDKKYNYSMRRSYMAKMGRPKSDNPMDKKVSVRFNQQEYDILLEYARTHEMTVTQVIKLCVEMKLLTKQ